MSNKIKAFKLLSSASNHSWIVTRKGHAHGPETPIKAEPTDIPTYSYVKNAFDSLSSKSGKLQTQVNDAISRSRENLKRIGKLDALLKGVLSKIESLPDEILNNLFARAETIEEIAKRVKDLLSEGVDLSTEEAEPEESSFNLQLDSFIGAARAEVYTNETGRKLWRKYGDELESDQYRRNQAYLNSRHGILIKGEHLHHVYIHFEHMRVGIMNRYMDLAKAVGIELDTLEELIKSQTDLVLEKHLKELSKAIDEMPMHTVEKLLSQEGKSELQKALSLFEIRLSEKMDQILSEQGLDTKLIQAAERAESIFAERLNSQQETIEAQAASIEEMKRQIAELREKLENTLSR